MKSPGKMSSAELKAYKRSMRNARLKDLHEGRQRGGTHGDARKEESKRACRSRIDWL